MLNPNHYTSLELSTKLAEGGCEVESNMQWNLCSSYKNDSPEWVLLDKSARNYTYCSIATFPAYDLFWDILKKLDEFFVTGNVDAVEVIGSFLIHENDHLLQETAIWNLCKFNPENQALKSDDPEGEPVRVDIWKSESTNLKATLEKGMRDDWIQITKLRR